MPTGEAALETADVGLGRTAGHAADKARCRAGDAVGGDKAGDRLEEGRGGAGSRALGLWVLGRPLEAAAAAGGGQHACGVRSGRAGQEEHGARGGLLPQDRGVMSHTCGIHEHLHVMHH